MASLFFYAIHFNNRKIPTNGYWVLKLFILYLPRFFIGYWILNGAGFSSGPPFLLLFSVSKVI